MDGFSQQTDSDAWMRVTAVKASGVMRPTCPPNWWHLCPTSAASLRRPQTQQRGRATSPSHLLTEKSRPLGRLEVEDCWRVCFAWLERTRECRSHPAALEAVRLCLAPSLDALESVTGRLAARAFRAYQQAAVCAFGFHWQKQCDCYFCSQWDWDLLLNSKVKRFVGWMDSEDS